MSQGHLVSERTVFTYGKPWPLGCLTGYVNRVGGFVLEHVVTFPGAPRGTLYAMLNDAMEEAWKRQYPYVVFYVPKEHPQHAGLTALGKRCGFTKYAGEWWVRHKP